MNSRTPLCKVAADHASVNSPAPAGTSPACFRQRMLQPATTKLTSVSITPTQELAIGSNSKRVPSLTDLTQARIMKQMLKPLASKEGSGTPVQLLSPGSSQENSPPGTPLTAAAPPRSTVRRAATPSSSISSLVELQTGSCRGRFGSVTRPLFTLAPMQPLTLSADTSTSSHPPAARKTAFPGITKLRLRLPSHPKMTGDSSNRADSISAADKGALLSSGVTPDSVTTHYKLVVRQTAFAGIKHLTLKLPAQPDSSSSMAASQHTEAEGHDFPLRGLVVNTGTTSPVSPSCYSSGTPSSQTAGSVGFPLRGLVFNTGSTSPVSPGCYSSGIPVLQTAESGGFPLRGLVVNTGACSPDTEPTPPVGSSSDSPACVVKRRTFPGIKRLRLRLPSIPDAASHNSSSSHSQAEALGCDFPLRGLVVNTGTVSPSSACSDSASPLVSHADAVPAKADRVNSSLKLSLAAAWHRHQQSADSTQTDMRIVSNATASESDSRQTEAMTDQLPQTNLVVTHAFGCPVSPSSSMCTTSTSEASPLRCTVIARPIKLQGALKHSIAAAWRRHHKPSKDFCSVQSCQTAAPVPTATSQATITHSKSSPKGNDTADLKLEDTEVRHSRRSASAAQGRCSAKSRAMTGLPEALCAVRRSARQAHAKAVSTAAAAVQPVCAAQAAVPAARSGSALGNRCDVPVAKPVSASQSTAAGKAAAIAQTASRRVVNRSAAVKSAANDKIATTAKLPVVTKVPAAIKAAFNAKEASYAKIAVSGKSCPKPGVAAKSSAASKDAPASKTAPVIKPAVAQSRLADKVAIARPHTRSMTLSQASSKAKSAVKPRWL